jgi:CubicO group peptidase (beta-lactamase class C family)
MKRLTVLLLFAMFCSSTAGSNRVVAQSAKTGLPTAKPEQVGMSSERLARIRTAMQRYVDRGLVPGVVMLVARRGRVVNFDAIGYRDVESKAPMTTDTIFRIASPIRFPSSSPNSAT